MNKNEMIIRFIRSKKGVEIVNDPVREKTIIKGCFVFCIPSIKKRVNNFLNSNASQITLHFGDETVILKREVK